MSEILFIDKPKGITSFDVIRILRKKLGVRKMGHGGTLDPLASGLLIIGIEKGTKKLNQYLNRKKTYIMDILLGKKTDTGDLEGKVIEEKKIKEIDIKEIKKVLKQMEGEIEMEAPIYSAIKVKGKPLYKYARAGEKIKPPKRKVTIFHLKLLNYKIVIPAKAGIHSPVIPAKAGIHKKEHTLRVEMECEKGTYARSVGEEIGKRLGYPATLKDLRRTKIGDIRVEDAKKL
ncbi:MAG: tRNA pseudouridine(55) synthase TruB, partial [Patescibacteria group bacterium]|nr:tRNA pseudouridine(55) synthase TruB [Patescibacteria group bacterium]